MLLPVLTLPGPDSTATPSADPTAALTDRPTRDMTSDRSIHYRGTCSPNGIRHEMIKTATLLFCPRSPKCSSLLHQQLNFQLKFTNLM
jgi:hypothetical protein